MKNLFRLFLLLITSGSYAQIRYEPGYFISNNNTRTECLIKNVASNNNPVSFEYKLTENSDVKIGRINEVKEYAVGEGYHYKRFEVNIDQSSNVPAKFSTLKDPEWKKETVFLKLMVQSDVNLYEYEEATHTRYFISSGNHETAEQLVYKEYITRDTGSRVFANNLYKRQLFMALKSPQLQQSDFEKLKYTKDSLLKLFLKYSNQEGKSFSNLDEKQNKSTLNFRINAGFNQGNITIAQTPNTFEYNSNDNAFRLGVELEIVLPFGQNKWALFTDPNYQYFKHEGTMDFRYTANDLPLKVDYSSIQIPVGIRHYFFLNKDKSKLFVNAGANVNLPLNSTIKVGPITEHINNATGLFGGLGFNHGRYSFEVRYNSKQKLQLVSSLPADYSSLGIIASYHLL